MAVVLAVAGAIKLSPEEPLRLTPGSASSTVVTSWLGCSVASLWISVSATVCASGEADLVCGDDLDEPRGSSAPRRLAADHSASTELSAPGPRPRARKPSSRVAGAASLGYALAFWPP